MLTARLMLLHRWLGLLMGPLILVAAGTTLALNHQDALKAAIDAGRPAQGPFDEYVLSALQDPTAPDHLLLGTHAGLYRSADAGRHWRPVTLPVPAKQVGALVGDPQAPRRVYALLRQAGLFVSPDFGDHWQAMPLPTGGEARPQYLALAGVSSRDLAVVTSAGLWSGSGDDWRLQPRPTSAPRQASRRLMQWAYDLHDGQAWGRYGVPVTDGVALTLIALVLTGYAVTANLGARRRPRRRATKGLTTPTSP